MKEDRVLKTIPIFQVDAFSTQLFSGNPAAVCPVSGFLTDKEMIAIAAENNLSETAFVDLTIDPFFIRWFTPKVEVNLCGHATLATARILFDEYLPDEVDCVEFNSKSGRLSATREENLIYLNFPIDEPKKINENALIEQALGHRPVDLLKGKDDILAVFDDEAIIKEITQAIETVPEIEILDVDMGADTNRTVVTIIGSPEAISEAAFQAVKRASELIDMSKHEGAHPRMGATDVCPFIPVSNISCLLYTSPSPRDRSLSRMPSSA